MAVSLNTLYGGGKGGGKGPWIPYDATLPVGKYTPGVVADAFYIGLVPNPKDPTKPPFHSIKVVFQLTSTGADGKRQLCGRNYSIVTGEKALLPKLLDALAIPFDFNAQYDSVEALAGNLCASLKGRACTVTLCKGNPRTKGDGHFIDIATVGPPLEGKENLAVLDYVRERDLGGAGDGGGKAQTQAATPAGEGATGDDGIPI